MEDSATPSPKGSRPKPPPSPIDHSDYVVYVDESGDHGMDTMDPTYPVFVLAFCIFEKKNYVEKVAPAVQQFKFKHWGHDMVILHETEMRKSRGSFTFLNNPKLREPFSTELTALIDEAPFALIATAIRKDRLRSRYSKVPNPYHIAMRFGLERVNKFLENRGQGNKTTFVIVEKRGQREDTELELEFLRICSGDNFTHRTLPLRLVFADKKVNSCGLQLADLVARPIGRHVLDATQPNRAFEVLAKKFDRRAGGGYLGYGLKLFP